MNERRKEGRKKGRKEGRELGRKDEGIVHESLTLVTVVDLALVAALSPPR
jgi:hypothetical protein